MGILDKLRKGGGGQPPSTDKGRPPALEELNPSKTPSPMGALPPRPKKPEAVNGPAFPRTSHGFGAPVPWGASRVPTATQDVKSAQSKPEPAAEPIVQASVDRLKDAIDAYDSAPPAVPVAIAPVMPDAPSKGYDDYTKATLGHFTAQSVAQLHDALGNPWKGFLGGLVSQAMASDIVVLNMGCGDVALVATDAGAATSHYKTIRRCIVDEWHFAITHELLATKPMMQELLQGLSNVSPLLRDDRHLDVYDDWVRQSITAKASDMHFMTLKSESKAVIKLRIFGAIKKWRHCHERLMLDVIAAAFGRRTKEASATREQFGEAVPIAFMTLQTVNGTRWEGRFNGRPYSNGYSGVMRLLDSEPKLDRVPTLEELGYTDSQRALIQPSILTNYGLIIIFGSTGSGKSTSLRTFMTRVMNPEKLSIYSVENPAEYPMPNVVQFSLPVDVTKSSSEIQQAFTAVLRDLMRMDPDVAMVAELRDYETARLAAELTQTEHRCFTTCHGSGAVAGLARLCGSELQMQPDTLAGQKFLSASIYQRLLPVLCPKCKLPASHAKEGISEGKQRLLRNKFKLDPGTMYVANPHGCSHCKPKAYGIKANGTLGVTVAAEILIPNAEIRAAILKRDWPQVEDIWRGQRRAGFGDPDMLGKTAFEAALYKVSQGQVSLKSVEEDFQPIEVYEVRALRESSPVAGVLQGSAA